MVERTLRFASAFKYESATAVLDGTEAFLDGPDALLRVPADELHDERPGPLRRAHRAADAGRSEPCPLWRPPRRTAADRCGERRRWSRSAVTSSRADCGATGRGPCASTRRRRWRRSAPTSWCSATRRPARGSSHGRDAERFKAIVRRLRAGQPSDHRGVRRGRRGVAGGLPEAGLRRVLARPVRRRCRTPEPARTPAGRLVGAMRTLQRLIIPALDVCPEVEHVRPAVRARRRSTSRTARSLLRQGGVGAHGHLLRRVLARPVGRSRARSSRSSVDLDISGSFALETLVTDLDGQERVVDRRQVDAATSARSAVPELAELGEGLLWFRLTCESAEGRLRALEITTDDEPARDVHLGVAITTFNRMPYVAANIARLSQLFKAHPDTAEDVSVIIVDNAAQPRAAAPRRRAGRDRAQPQPRRRRRLRPRAVGAPPPRAGDPRAVHGRRHRLRAGGDRPHR